jgi:DNA-binding transcriptional ArsR family regulator
MNMTEFPSPSQIAKVSDLLQSISAQPRLEIILAIGVGEACVCHLEAFLGQRQAYISQHLMALREAGVLTARREGRFIFYRLADVELLDLIRHAARLAGIPADPLAVSEQVASPSCECPKCTAGAPALITIA